MKKVLYTFFCLFIAAGVVGHAQNPPPPVSPNGDQPDPNDIRAMITWKLVEYLDMNEEQSASFFPEWNKYHMTRGKINHERNIIVRKILAEVEDTTVSVDSLLARVEELQQNRGQEFRLMVEFYESVRKFLDNRQYVKLMVFEEKLKEDLFKEFGGRRRRDPERQ